MTLFLAKNLTRVRHPTRTTISAGVVKKVKGGSVERKVR
jgi:hypothetical protein